MPDISAELPLTESLQYLNKPSSSPQQQGLTHTMKPHYKPGSWLRRSQPSTASRGLHEIRFNVQKWIDDAANRPCPITSASGPDDYLPRIYTTPAVDCIAIFRCIIATKQLGSSLISCDPGSTVESKLGYMSHSTAYLLLGETCRSWILGRDFQSNHTVQGLYISISDEPHPEICDRLIGPTILAILLSRLASRSETYFTVEPRVTRG